MSCPSFGDLGKDAKDVFRSGFHLGLANFSVTSVFKNLNIGGSLRHNLDENSTNGGAFIGIESEDFGKTIGKFTNGGVFSLQHFFKKGLFQDVDVNGIYSYNTESTKSIIQVNSNFVTDNFHGNCSLMSDNWSVAMNGLFAKKGDSQLWTLGIGGKYEWSDGAIFRCKVDKDQQIGISFSQRLRDMLNLTLSFNIDSANLDSGGHKAGISFELEA